MIKSSAIKWFSVTNLQGCSSPGPILCHTGYKASNGKISNHSFTLPSKWPSSEEFYSPLPNTEAKMSISNGDLFERARVLLFEKSPTLLSFILEKKKIDGVDDVDTLDIDIFLQNFLKLAKKKYKDSGSNIRNMEKNHGDWLSQEANIPNLNPLKKPRKSKDFTKLSKSSKNRLTSELRASNETSKLMHATKTALKTDGKNDLAFVIDEAAKSPGRALKFRRLSGVAASLNEETSRSSLSRSNLSLPTKIAADDALAHLFYTDMGKDAYVRNRLMSKSHGADIWPTYNEIRAAKKLCRPANIKYGETAVIAPLSERLRHNDERLVKIFDIRFHALLQDVAENGTLVIEGEEKIGFDGSTGNSIYNQGFSLDNRDATEASLLSTCLVPLQYRTTTGEVLFTNPVPQASTFCQPVRLEYRKETPEASKEIDAWIDEEVAKMDLEPIKVQVGTKSIQFRHQVRKTMLDVKAKNAVTDTSSALRCFVCNATSAHFNDINNISTKFPTKEETLAFGGICDLHAWLRGFDAINNLSDKLEVKKWKVIKKEDKEKVEARKKKRQAEFKTELNLNVDVPRSGGAGNSNTGNVARDAFQDEEVFARITGVDKNLIHRIHVMLIVINTDQVINLEAFKAYGLATAKLWIDLYAWFNMPPTMHQLFFHAWESIRLSTLPLSFFSEQSLESCNKYFKSDREHHSRKDSRLHTIQDQFHRQSDKSDLLIALKLSEKQKKKLKGSLPQDVLELLISETLED